MFTSIFAMCFFLWKRFVLRVRYEQSLFSRKKQKYEFICFCVHCTNIINTFFNVHGSVHRINILLHIIPTRYTIHRVYFYLTIALHVSGVTITHCQEHKTTVTTASGNRYTVLLSVAIVEELGLISSDSSTIATDNSTV